MEAIAGSLSKLLQFLRSSQDREGAFTGSLRSGMLNFYYAASLVLDGEPPTSPIIQDLCDFVESCETKDGGVSIYPGEPTDGMNSFQASLLLGWARPHSNVGRQAREYLRRTEQKPPPIPLIHVSRYVFAPEKSAALVNDRGPHESLRRFGMRAWPNAWSLVSYRKMFAQPFRPAPKIVDLLMGPTMQWMFWPSLRDGAQLPWLMPPHMNLAILPPFAALRKLAGDTSPAVARLNEITRRYMDDYIYDDGTLLYLNYLPSFILYARAFGDEKLASSLRSGLRGIVYKNGGWLSGAAVSINVLDTALTVQGLLACGVEREDPLVDRAVSFLKNAQSPNGAWSWGYSSSMGRRFRTGDTDDTGAACTALVAAGVDPSSPAIVAAAAVIARLQTSAGGINTFDIGPAANTVAVSNTCRALLALSAAGYAREHPAIERGCRWLLEEQESDGKWVDYWIARWIYGTVVAADTLIKLGRCAPGSPAIDRAAFWLLRQQNSDGGWGEDWRGTRSRSTAEHTAMAVYGLCIASRPESRPLAAIQNGVRWLIEHQRAAGDWEAAYVGAYSLMEGYASTQIPAYWILQAFAAYRRMVDAPDTRLVQIDKRRKAPRPAPEPREHADVSPPAP